MSIIHMDFPSGGQGLYGTTAARLLDGMYVEATNVSITNDPDTTISGKAVLLGSGNQWTVLRKTLTAGLYTIGFACRIYIPSLPTSPNYKARIVQFRNVSNASILSIVVNTDGSISAYKQEDATPFAGGTLIGISNPGVILANAWQHVEVKAFLNATTGTTEVRVNGNTVLNLTGDNLGNTGPCTQIAQGRSSFFSGDGQFYAKDWIIWDTVGTLNNNFMGSCSVKELIPASDTSLTWALNGSLTGYDAVNEAPPNDDTNYIYATSPAPAADTMGLSDLPVDVSSVRGLMVITRSKNTDGGDGKLQMGLTSGGSTVLGADRQLTTTYTYWTDISETDPATSSQWLPGSVNNVTLRFNRTL